MIRSTVIATLMVLPLAFFQLSCSSVDTTDEDIMMALDEEAGVTDDSGLGQSEGIEEDFLDDQAIAEEFSDGGMGDEWAAEDSAPAQEDPFAEDFAMDESAPAQEDPFAEDFAMDDSAPAGEDPFAEFSEEEFSDEAFAEENFSEEELFAEEGMGDQAFEEGFDQDLDEAFAEEPFAEQDLAQQPMENAPVEPQMSEEPVFEEPAFDEPSQEAFVGADDPMMSTAGSSAANVEITDIRYLANEAGGTVLIETSGQASYQTRVNPDTNQYIVEVAGARLPERLKRPYILKEFNGSFAAINAYQSIGSNTARIVVQMKGSATPEPMIQQEANQLMVIPSSQTPVEQVAQQEAELEVPAAGSGQAEEVALTADAESFDVKAAQADAQLLGARTLDEFLMGNNRFYGRRISIQVKEVDIREALNFISEEGGINMIISDDVKGSVSLKLKEVPWDQALVTVMRAKKLGYLRQGNVIRISTLKTLQEETDAARKIIESQKAMTPLRVKVLPVSFAKVEDMVKQIEPFLTAKRGSVVADKRTSSLIVTDTDEVLKKVARLVKELDLPPAQVMIEGKIVEAQEQFSKTLGVNWGLSGSQVQLSDSAGINGGAVNLESSIGISPTPIKAINESPGLWEFNIGAIDVLGSLSAQLALAEKDELAKVISSPRVVTMNKEKAEINQKTEAVTITSVLDQNGILQKQVTRDDVELKLSVTPQITSDGSVIMEVEVKRQFLGSVADLETGARPINTRGAKTKILVKNGQTAVIGGIYQSDVRDKVDGVPGLKDIPVLGWLFKSKTYEKLKNELLIFLTPKVLNSKDMAVET